jgi:PhnB protein
MTIHPYLCFEGRADEAIAFYVAALGAKVDMLMRFDEMPGTGGAAPMVPPGSEKKVMHATLTVGGSVIHVSDGRCGGHAVFSGTALSLTAESDTEADRLFTALADGGKITMPIGKTFFSSRFGMVNDRFGVPWLILVRQ